MGEEGFVPAALPRNAMENLLRANQADNLNSKCAKCCVANVWVYLISTTRLVAEMNNIKSLSNIKLNSSWFQAF